MSRDLEKLCKSSLKPESKYKCVRSLVEASSILKPLLDYELEESGRRQGVSNHYKI